MNHLKIACELTVEGQDTMDIKRGDAKVEKDENLETLKRSLSQVSSG